VPEASTKSVLSTTGYAPLHRLPREEGSDAATTVPLAGAIVVYGLGMAFQSSSLSLFLANAVHAAPILVGVYFTVRAAAGIVVNQAAGRLSDRMRDRRLLLVVAGIAGAVGSLTLSFVRDYPLVLATGMVFLSIGGITFSQLFAYANSFALARRRDITAFGGLMRAFFSAAWVVGPPLGLFLLAALGFRPLYLIVAVLSLATAAVGRWGLPPVAAPITTRPGTRPAASSADSGRGRAQRGQASRRGAWRGKLPTLPARLWLLLAVVLLVGIINQAYGIDMPLDVTKHAGHGAELAGWMAGVTAACEIPIMIFTGRIARRLGPGRIVGWSAAVGVVYYALMPFASAVPALLAMAVFNGVYQGVSLSLPMAMVQDEAPGGPGSASALYTSAFGLAGMLAGTVTGVVTAAVGYADLFWVSAGMSACAAVLMAVRARLPRRL
jgi:MFS transporter, SET family, sugar efflux transporter